MFKFENQYRGNLTVIGASCHFTDDICEKLDCNLIDNEIIKCDEIIYQEKLKLENEMTLMVEIVYSNTDNEWVCTCKEFC